jgi:hypothetical protein
MSLPKYRFPVSQQMRNFVVEAKFMWNAFAVFGIGSRLQLSLFAAVDGIPIGGMSQLNAS